jgi:hypothetical protein
MRDAISLQLPPFVYMIKSFSVVFFCISRISSEPYASAIATITTQKLSPLSLLRTQYIYLNVEKTIKNYIFVVIIISIIASPYILVSQTALGTVGIGFGLNCLVPGQASVYQDKQGA